MARSVDPLQRDTINVAAQLPTARLQVGPTNAALQLADALKDASPDAQRLMQGIANDEAEKQRSQAKQDALINEGQALADATRAGKIDATQNPWYIQAYNRESASIQSLDALQKLQVEAASWDSYNDPEKFQEDWHRAVGEAGVGFTTKDQQAGFQAAENQVSSQVLQENVARNVARIKTERVNNLGALTADALQTTYRTNGGLLSPNDAVASIRGAAQQWFATGGSEADWQQILVKSITNLAYATSDSSLLDLLKAPELMHGPSQSGVAPAGLGAMETSSYSPPYSQLPPAALQAVDPDLAPAAAPVPMTPKVQVQAPAQRLTLSPVQGGRLSSGYGARKRPTKGASSNHLALDIALPSGTPVSAQATGKVVYAARDGGLGNVVRVDYGGGVVATYAHLSAIGVSPGDVVAAGQNVGAVGKTGTATGPHLHYAVKVNGKPVDPRTNPAIGGTFEGDQVAQQASQPGFPGADKPFTVSGELPGNVLNRGASLYGMPGVADQVESDRYRINEAAAAAPLQRARVEKAKRQARGYEARDLLWQQFGTGLLTGAATREQIITSLSSKNYSGPEIAEALNQVNEVLRDSVGVANAQVAARGQNPGSALDVLNIVSDAQRSGWSPQLEKRVGDAILRGDISGGDGEQIITSAVSKASSMRAEARTEERLDMAEEKANGGVSNYTDLKRKAGFLGDLVVQSLAQAQPGNAAKIRSPKVTKAIKDRISSAMGAWLAANPDDWGGALQAGKDAANAALTSAMGQPATKIPFKPSGDGNPRR